RLPRSILGPESFDVCPVCAMAPFTTLGLLTAVLACHSLALSQTGEDPTEPIASALRAREFDKAVELTRSGLRASPGSAQLWTLQGIAFAGKGNALQRPQLSAAWGGSQPG